MAPNRAFLASCASALGLGDGDQLLDDDFDFDETGLG
jgi:hypothetical protein